ncbi:MAG TPA: hypothetical protein VHH90_04745, partial [Polyangia bacterium]|nr:hypothetical protein [Polyangia bacterium]
DEAQRIRRSCRLERFDMRLETERRQEVATEDRARTDRIQDWLDKTEPPRVTRPMSIDAFAGTGLSSYGLTFGWAFLRHWELGAWLGRRPISCLDDNLVDDADCSRTSYGVRFLWYIADRALTPFLGTGLSITSSHLQIQDPSSSNGSLLIGSGRANSLSPMAGFQLEYRAFRMSVAYVFEYVFYTGASLDDQKKSPNQPLQSALADSLRNDRNGVRFEVGFAF